MVTQFISCNEQPTSNLLAAVMNNMFNEVDVSPFLKFKDVLNQTYFATKYIVTHPRVQKLLKSDVKFDLVISELALNEAVLGELELSQHKLLRYVDVFKRFLGILQVPPHLDLDGWSNLLGDNCHK